MTSTLRTLFVRGVPRSFDEDAFARIFEVEGVIKSFLIRKEGGDGHKGIGFVEFDSVQNAQAALDTLNSKRVGDRELKA